MSDEETASRSTVNRVIVSGNVDITHHFDPLRIIIARAHYPGQAITVFMTIGGSLMPARISIDDATQLPTLHWTDDKGDTDAAPPANAQIAFQSSDEAVATADPASGKITPVAEGNAQLLAAITDSSSGGPLMEPDGTTAFQVQPADFSVVAGAATGLTIEVPSTPGA